MLLSVLMEAASILTLKLSMDRLDWSNRINPCRPVKEPVTVNPKFLTLNSMADPWSTGSYCASACPTAATIQTNNIPAFIPASLSCHMAVGVDGSPPAGLQYGFM